MRWKDWSPSQELGLLLCSVLSLPYQEWSESLGAGAEALRVKSKLILFLLSVCSSPANAPLPQLKLC